MCDNNVSEHTNSVGQKDHLHSVENGVCHAEDAETSMKMNDKTAKELTVDEMLDIVGPYGKFQKTVNFLFCVMTVPPIFQIMIMFFAADEPGWKCADNSTNCKLNGTFEPIDRRRCDFSRKDWVYVKPQDYSIVTHFDIGCKDEYMIQLLTSVFFLGWLLGAFILGFCADNYGRKITLIISETTVIITGFVSIFMPNLALIVVCRFIIGFFIPGTFAQMFILITEIVDGKHRPLAGIMIFASGLTSLSILGIKAYLIKDWRYLHIACTAPYVFVVFFFKFTPESVRYLRVNGQMEELGLTFQRIARWNKKSIPPNVTVAPLESENKHKSNPLHLFRNKSLALKTTIQTFAYFTNGIVYYGLYLAAADFSGDKYRDYIVISFTEIPIAIIGIYFCEKIGRKNTSIIPMLIAAAACVALGYIPKGGWKKIVRIVLGMLGKCLVGSNSNTMMTWSMEMYPTVLRGEAMGFFQAFMRLGAASAPWMDKELVKFYKPASYLFMAALALATFLFLGLLPETKDVPTHDTEFEHQNAEIADTNHVENGVELSGKSRINGALEVTD